MADGWWTTERQSNLLDGAAPFYRAYETADGRHVAVGALEPQFFAALLQGLGLTEETVGPQNDRAGWPQMGETFAEVFRSRTRDEWSAHFDGTDACVAPVLSMAEAPAHPHNVARGTFVERSGVVQPAPAPRFSATPAEPGPPPARPGEHTDDILRYLGFDADEASKIRGSGAVS
jgi:alpha-methylacyl-CoA racemase